MFVDVVVLGGGNAALCAAINAARGGCSVLLLESAPKPYRGGNSRHTRNFRCMHHGPLGPLTNDYLEDEYFEDLLKVTKGKTDETLARKAICESEACLPWMEQQGIRFQPSLSGTLSLSRTNAFFLGGGKALVNALYRTAESLGVDVRYEAEVTHLDLSGSKVVEVVFDQNGQEQRVTPKAVVAASGGFQGDTDWLERAWGEGAQNFLIRGTKYNRGVVLRDLLAQGAQSVGDPTQCHAVAIDGRAPKFDGGIASRLDCVPFSVVLNKDGQRFYDEGEDVWPKRYAIWGRLVAAQPDQVGYAIIDSRSLELFMPSLYPPTKNDDLGGLLQDLGLPVEESLKTIQDFNVACGNDLSGFQPMELDGLGTTGIEPAKTNWARPIVEPPFYGYSLRPGVTFTYLGLKVGEDARVQLQDGPAENLWAAGEIMAGSILGQGYLAGFGMTIGTVFGRTAGEEVARYVKG